MDIFRTVFHPPDCSLSPDGQQLMAWLSDPDPETLAQASASGALARVIPEWARLTGPRNIQHSTHYFPLDQHTLQVVAGTVGAPAFSTLPPYLQGLTALSALLHDIDKNTGPERLRGKLPVDKLHPIKSAEVSQRVLRRLGFSEATCQRVYTLIHHHQVFGRLFIFYPEGAPDLATDKIALRVRSSPILQGLVALNEGDIRGVKAHDALFTDKVHDQLPLYGQRVAQRIAQMTLGKPLLSQSLRYESDPSPHLNEFSGFVLSRPTPEGLWEAYQHLPTSGAMGLRYVGDLAELAALGPGLHLLLHTLPENIAFLGPLPEALPESLSMRLFFGVLHPESFGIEQLSVAETRSLQHCQTAQQTLAGPLAQWAKQYHHSDWASLSQHLECRGFTGAGDTHPATLHALGAFLREQVAAEALWGLLTRPMAQGLILPPGMRLPDEAEAEALPVFTGF